MQLQKQLTVLSRATAEAENLKRLLCSTTRLGKKNQLKKFLSNLINLLYSQNKPQDQILKLKHGLKKNSWFGDDQAMTFAAFGIHKELVEEGVDPTSDQLLLKWLINEMAEVIFHTSFLHEQSAPVQQVAASSRGASGKKIMHAKLRLTPSQVAIAKRLNVPLEEYARAYRRSIK